MELYLLRHAEAVDQAPSDSARQLTPHGLEQARQVGIFCHRQGLVPELILSSPYRRAAQTAELLAAPFRQTVQSAPFLASGMHPATALAELRAYTRLRTLFLVGHQPDLGLLAATLLGLTNSESFPFGKASLLGLEVDHPAPGSASLRFFLPVQLMS